MGYRRDRKLVAKYEAQKLREQVLAEKKAMKERAQQIRAEGKAANNPSNIAVISVILFTGGIFGITALSQHPLDRDTAPVVAEARRLEEAERARADAEANAIAEAQKLAAAQANAAAAQAKAAAAKAKQAKAAKRIDAFLIANAEPLAVAANREVCRYRSSDGFKGAAKVLMLQDRRFPSFPELTADEQNYFSERMTRTYWDLLAQC